MIFDRYRTGIWIRILLIIISLMGSVYLWIIPSFYLSAVFLFVTCIGQVIALYRYMEKTFRQIANFFDSIVYDDYSQTFRSNTHNPDLDALHASIRQTSEQLKEIRREAEEYRQFLQSMVHHLPIGLLVFDEKEKIVILNPATKKLFEINTCNSLNELPAFCDPLKKMLKSINSESRSLVRIQKPEQLLELAVYANTFRLQNNLIHVVSIQNIEQELTHKELESWESMMRVLTHEIMNSITPITSLSATVNDLLEGEQTPDQLQDIRQAMRTIERRSIGLLKFVENFRRLTRLPDPEYITLPVKELFDHLLFTFRDQMQREGIQYSVSLIPETLKITADREMAEQILINLLLNSIQALRQTEDKKIKLRAFLDEKSRVNIVLTDNGSGISPDAEAKVFIPFFTTKKEGSGIGLSLSRQMMKLHKGSISFNSIPGQSTTFTLLFP